MPYRVHGLDHTGGEHNSAESGAVLLYLAEKSGKLIPTDFQGRIRVIQWGFAALNTIERPMQEIQLIDKFVGGACDEERRLDGRDWIAEPEFTVADILLVTVLRQIRKTDLLQPYPRVTAYLACALERPAWQRAFASYAQRLDAVVSEIA